MANAEKRILVVDDDPEILGLLSIRLKRKGYHLYEAMNGQTAIETAREQRPDLIILDVMMPEKNGWEVAREIRKHSNTAHIPILMLTAIGDSLNEMTSSLYGANDFVNKPFEFEELEGKVQKLLQVPTNQ